MSFASSPLPNASLSEGDFQAFREMIRDRAGISLSPAKRDLVQSRLRDRLSALRLPTHAEYRKLLEGLSDGDPEWQEFVNCLTTNKTDWFREPQHFRELEEGFLPRWRELKKSHLKVWCAASSTGEEPYTLSLVLHRLLKPSGLTYEILASDIDTEVLSYAANGVYSWSRIEGQVPELYRSGFVRGRDGIEDWGRVREEIRKPVSFRQVNLMEGLPGPSEEFDLIFLRNVLIYFDAAGATNVVEKLFEHAAKDALLVIAHSESLQNVKTRWRYRRPSLYHKGTKFL